MGEDLQANSHDDILGQLRSMTDEQLLEELKTGMRVNADNLLRMALVVKELESRGADLSGVKLGLLHHLRRIACGQMLPEVVTQFAWSPALIARIGSLPLSEQRKLVDGDRVKMLTYGPDGSMTHRLADPVAMTPDQVNQVFARDHIRDDSEQALWLDRRVIRERAKKAIPERIGDMHIDKEREGVVVGRTFIPLDHLRRAVKALSG
jgi:hypothetical protein